MRRVAITGVGIVSCLGTDPETVAGRLRRGESGITVDPERTARGFRSPLTARIEGFDPRGLLGRKARKTMTAVRKKTTTRPRTTRARKTTTRKASTTRAKTRAKIRPRTTRKASTFRRATARKMHTSRRRLRSRSSFKR